MTASKEDEFIALNVEATQKFKSSRYPLKLNIIIKRDSTCHVFCRRFLICILLVSTVVLASIIYGIYQYVNALPYTCHSKECLRAAAAFKENMNLNVDPCTDFYTYVCGNWADDHPRPENNIGNNWYAERQLKVYRNIRDRLEANASRSDPKPVAQAKDMYKACLDLDERKRLGFKVVTKYLKEFGIPILPTLLNNTAVSPRKYEFDWIATVAKIQRKLGFNILIGFNVVLDRSNMNQNQLALEYHYSPGDVTFPPYEWSKLHAKSRKSRVALVDDEDGNDEDGNDDEQDAEEIDPEKIGEDFMEAAEAIIPGFNATKYESGFKTLGEIYVKFITKLETEDTAGNDDENVPTDYTIEELQNITDTYIAPRKPYPIWQHYLDELFAELPADAKPTTADKVQIYSVDVDYLKRLIDVVSEEQVQVIELYIWKVVYDLIVSHNYNDLKSEEECAQNVHTLMGLAVSYAIANKDFLENTKPRIERMLEDIRLEFDGMVLETDWMDAYTKYATLEKSKAMESLIGLPEWILDVDKLEQHYQGINRSRHMENWLNAIALLNKNKLRTWRVKNERFWKLDPTEVNAFNLLRRNAINIPVAIIQYPFYYLGLESLNYGALGVTLGHELTHSFDDAGRNFDKFGNMTRWWSESTLEEYDKRAECMVEQYSSYYVKEAGGFIDGNRTLGENIADNGGLREAFRAYQAYVKRNGPEPMLPGFEDFSPEQLFFISFGNQYCETLSPTFGDLILEDEHSPAEFRVKGVLSNMEQFSETFQCASGSPMNPKKKCRVW